MAGDNPTDVPIPKLSNIVATFSVGQSFVDLQALTMRACFVEFNASRFAAAVLRLVDPKTTCLIFASGKGVCTGARNEHLAQLAATKYVALLRLAGVPARLCDFKIQNMVSTVHCPFRIDLVGFERVEQGFCSYEPHLFPGLMYRVRSSHTTPKGQQTENVVVFLVFVSGKCVITGGKSRLQILSTWRTFYRDRLCQHIEKVNHGSSGSYRTSNTISAAIRNRDLMLQIQYSSSKRVLAQKACDNAPGCNVASFANDQMQAFDRIRGALTDNDPFAEPSGGEAFAASAPHTKVAQEAGKTLRGDQQNQNVKQHPPPFKRRRDASASPLPHKRQAPTTSR